MSEERTSNKNGSQLAEEIDLTITREKLDKVARQVGIDNGRVLHAMLAQPDAVGDIYDYTTCVAWCVDNIENEKLAEKCIEGCAKASSSFSTATRSDL